MRKTISVEEKEYELLRKEAFKKRKTIKDLVTEVIRSYFNK